MRKVDNQPPSCVVVTKSGNLNFLEPSRPVQACNGTALSFYICTDTKINKMCDPTGLKGIIFRKLPAQVSLLYMYSYDLSFILRFLNGDFFAIVNSRMININTEKRSKILFKIWAIRQEFSEG